MPQLEIPEQTAFFVSKPDTPESQYKNRGVRPLSYLNEMLKQGWKVIHTAGVDDLVFVVINPPGR